jgi:hypothetical protein
VTTVQTDRVRAPLIRINSYADRDTARSALPNAFPSVCLERHDSLGRLSSASLLRSGEAMLSRLTAVWLGLLVCEGVLSAAGQSVILDADRYIKTGTRIPELPAGEGGELRIDAPHELCRDPRYLLEVRSFSDHPPLTMPAVRLTAGPSACTWLFERMPVGPYEAVILLPRDERIVATGRGSLSTGMTTVITLEPAETEVEGRLTSAESLPSPLRLNFAVHGRNRWTARVASDGSYHVTLGDVEEGTLLTILADPDGLPGSEATSASTGSRWRRPQSDAVSCALIWMTSSFRRWSSTSRSRRSLMRATASLPKR